MGVRCQDRSPGLLGDLVYEGYVVHRSCRLVLEQPVAEHAESATLAVGLTSVAWRVPGWSSLAIGLERRPRY